MDKTTMAILVMLAQRARRARNIYRQTVRDHRKHEKSMLRFAVTADYTAWAEANNALQCAKQVLNEMTPPEGK